jgi:hypothetical protein
VWRHRAAREPYRIKEVPLQHGVTMTPYRGPVAQRRFDGHFPAAPQKTRHQNVAVRDRARNPASAASFRTPRPALMCEMPPRGGISREVRFNTRWRRTGWLGRRDSNLCIWNRNLPRLSARGAGLEHAHLELKARPIDASIPLRRDSADLISRCRGSNPAPLSQAVQSPSAVRCHRD